MPRPTTNDITDYEFLTGVGIEGQYGLAKIAKVSNRNGALVDWGCVTLFLASVPDA
jgi:predicted RNA-binding protein (virulence factor B family)